MQKDDVVIAIPTKDASSNLLPLIKDLSHSGFTNIVIVNDGCNDNRLWIFDEAKNNYNCDVINHAVHLGKGRSLKSAFNYILNKYSDKEALITVDDAGVHSIEEVNKCLEVMNVFENKLVLGYRDFKNMQVPTITKIGNKISRKLIRLFTGIDVEDATTGLRGMSLSIAKRMLKVEGEGLDYEINMLLESKEKKIEICGFKIAVEYKGQDMSKTYMPLIYSIKPYLVFIKYTLTSVVATVLDFIIFTTAVASLKWVVPNFYIIFSTIIARIFSSSLNFFLTKNAVFKNDDSMAPQMARSFILVGIQMILSAILVTLIYRVLPITETLVKLLVDGSLFIIFYPIQREWVFNTKNDKKEND